MNEHVVYVLVDSAIEGMNRLIAARYISKSNLTDKEQIQKIESEIEEFENFKDSISTDNTYTFEVFENKYLPLIKML